MKHKTFFPFKCKILSNPCTRNGILRIFKFRFRLKRPLFIRRGFGFRRRGHSHEPKTSPPRKLTTGLRSLFNSLRKSREMDRLMALKSFSDAGWHQKAPFPSPLTPAAAACASRMSTDAAAREDEEMQEDVEEACRSFEKYLVEMIVEEGKVGDLMDVEDLLHYWKNLKSPVFVDLVCRFYGELCKDLFSNRKEEEENMGTSY